MLRIKTFTADGQFAAILQSVSLLCIIELYRSPWCDHESEAVLHALEHHYD